MIDYILTFLANYVPFENPEENRTFMDKIDSITGKRNTMGIIEQIQEIRYKEAEEKGILEGLQKAKHEMVKNLLQQTEFSDDKIASLANVSVAFVEKARQDLN
jgi:flagellar biosynthesis/type III secretory pathway protein FliH